MSGLRFVVIALDVKLLRTCCELRGTSDSGYVEALRSESEAGELEAGTYSATDQCIVSLAARGLPVSRWHNDLGLTLI